MGLTNPYQIVFILIFFLITGCGGVKEISTYKVETIPPHSVDTVHTIQTDTVLIVKEVIKPKWLVKREVKLKEKEVKLKDKEIKSQTKIAISDNKRDVKIAKSNNKTEIKSKKLNNKLEVKVKGLEVKEKKSDNKAKRKRRTWYIWLIVGFLTREIIRIIITFLK